MLALVWEGLSGPHRPGAWRTGLAPACSESGSSLPWASVRVPGRQPRLQGAVPVFVVNSFVEVKPP